MRTRTLHQAFLTVSRPPEGVHLRLPLTGRPPGPHSARLALSPRPNRASEGGIQSDLLAVRLGVPDCAPRIREIVLEVCTGAS